LLIQFFYENLKEIRQYMMHLIADPFYHFAFIAELYDSSLSSTKKKQITIK